MDQLLFMLARCGSIRIFRVLLICFSLEHKAHCWLSVTPGCRQ
jgi:hypothetical protein